MPAITELPYPHHEVKKELEPQSLRGLSKPLLDQHWMLYKGYVTNVNLLNKIIWDTMEPERRLNEPRTAEAQRRLGFEYNGMILHELYFEALKKKPTPLLPADDMAKQLVRDFGGFDRWKKQFSEIGKMRGVGWALLSRDPGTQRLINSWVEEHDKGVVVGHRPLVAMDVWEHAFVGDYGPSAEGRAKYIDAFFENLDWGVVSSRFRRL